MKRREFLVAGSAAGLVTWGDSSSIHAASESSANRQCYELRHYLLDSEEQRKGLDQFLAEAAVPALNRLDLSPVGVFAPLEGYSPVTVLLPHPNVESAATLVQRMGSDSEFTAAASEFLNAPALRPAYARMESSLI